jgi:antirestriction protein
MRRDMAKPRAAALLAVLAFGAPAAYAAEKRHDLHIVIETIDHSKQRYPTVGDWQIDKAGNLHITISKMSDQRYEFLVAAHEMIEAYLAIRAGVSPTAVDKFDEAYEAKRKPGDDSEPGDDPRAPYYRQHQVETGIERLLAVELGVNWGDYDREVSSK